MTYRGPVKEWFSFKGSVVKFRSTENRAFTQCMNESGETKKNFLYFLAHAQTKVSLAFLRSMCKQNAPLLIVPSSFAYITRALRGCFRGGLVFVAFRFILKQSKTSNSGDVFFDILITSKGASTPALVRCNTFRNLNESLNKRWMYPAQTITIEWTAEKSLDKCQMTNKLPKTS